MEGCIELTETKTVNKYGTLVSRIRATQDIPYHNVKKGDLGGWASHEECVEDNAWIADEAQVFGNATIKDNAIVRGKAIVWGDAVVYAAVADIVV